MTDAPTPKLELRLARITPYFASTRRGLGVLGMRSATFARLLGS